MLINYAKSTFYLHRSFFYFFYFYFAFKTPNITITVIIIYRIYKCLFFFFSFLCFFYLNFLCFCFFFFWRKKRIIKRYCHSVYFMIFHTLTSKLFSLHYFNYKIVQICNAMMSSFMVREE